MSPLHEPAQGGSRPRGGSTRSVSGAPLNFLSLNGLSFGYPGQAPAVAGLNLGLAAGEIHCLVVNRQDVVC